MFFEKKAGEVFSLKNVALEKEIASRVSGDCFGEYGFAIFAQWMREAKLAKITPEGDKAWSKIKDAGLCALTPKRGMEKKFELVRFGLKQRKVKRKQ
ncbi:hypothetical protein NPX99_01520 [Bartonella sp. 220]|uniref:hypothetical protein n=1 Tax=Bartonella sp. 220B TaxID=2967260 RepID=UPI0022A9A599|nr:hypothetical protein [Bartonella sp. 220B]MCZ2157971.1 hypothetical protein [Bartonella sp. 220B]